MIKIRIKNGDHEIDIRFPISESELYASRSRYALLWVSNDPHG